MKGSLNRSWRTPRIVDFAIVGFAAGLLVAWTLNPLPLGSRTQILPQAYCLPKIPGGASFRFAMAHDVVHERYLPHGAAWYTQRNADARKIIADQSPAPGAPPSSQYLDAFDDLAVGLLRTGKAADAIAILQKKLLLISPLPPPPATRPVFNPSNHLDAHDIDSRDLQNIEAAMNLSPLQHHQYTTFANLGTIILLKALPNVLAGDTTPAIRSQLHESLDDIERAIAINPAGHFGREVWQAILIEHLLAAFDHPDLLTQFDMIGEPLNAPTGGYNLWASRSRFDHKFLDFFAPNLTPDDRFTIRFFIDRVGTDPNWATEVNPDYSVPMPFDEPNLAIIGMWTLGGGPNPHFALALARIMDNLGQRQIAWNAYERAVELQDGFWPDANIRAKFVTICRARQDDIAKIESPDNPAAWQQKMRAQHTIELAWGLAYQKDYQDFEVSQIAAGVPLNDPNFYTPFFKSRAPIASSPGLSDDVILTQLKARTFSDYFPCLLLCIGAGMSLSLLIPKKILS